MGKKKAKRINYRLEGIIDYKFKVEESSDSIELFKSEETKTNIKSKFIPIVENERLVCEIQVKCFYQEDDSDIEFLFYECVERMAFFIEGLENHVKEDELILPRNFLIDLASVSYSTMRGILHQKLSSYRYRKGPILPILNPEKLVREDFKIKIKE